MKFNHIIWLFIITGFLNLQSTSADAMVLEREEIISYKLETVSENPKILKISGLSGHSAMAVNNITTRTTEGKTLIIYINLILGPLKPKARGDFEYQLEIPDDIDTIQMGKKKAIIWERKSGPATTKYKVDGLPPWLIEKNKTKTP